MATIENLQNNVQVSVNTNIIDTNFDNINTELTALYALVNSLASTTVPTGTILPFGGSVAPANAILCDGRTVSRTGTYSKLFSIIGTTYGAGNGSTTFNVPDLKGKIPVGLDNSVSPKVEFNSLGKTGGADVVALDTTKIPNHSHNMTHGHTADDTAEGVQNGRTNVQGYKVQTSSSGVFAVHPDINISNPSFDRTWTHDHDISVINYTGNTSTDGGNGTSPSHNNLQPYVVTNYIIIAQ